MVRSYRLVFRSPKSYKYKYAFWGCKLIYSLQSKKRGMSLEDKRTALLDIFHDTKEPYVLKVEQNFASRSEVVYFLTRKMLTMLPDAGP